VSDRVRLTVNGVERAIEADADTPLLYALRNDLGLKGTRFGCGSGQCGACFVLVDGHAIPACDTPLWSVAGKRVTTVEGLGGPQAAHALKEAFIAEQAAQCGYCYNGQIIKGAELLFKNPQPTELQIRSAMNGHLCRCGTYPRILTAIERAGKAIQASTRAAASRLPEEPTRA